MSYDPGLPAMGREVAATPQSPQDKIVSEYRAEKGMQTVDPTTVESLIAMCTGALEDTNRAVTLLQEVCGPVRNMTDLVSPTPNLPEANCELGHRLVGVYAGIVETTRRLDTLRSELRIS